MKRRIMRYPPPIEQRRYRQHQQAKRKGLSYSSKQRCIFITQEKWEETLPKPAQILKDEYHYAIQQTIE